MYEAGPKKARQYDSKNAPRSELRAHEQPKHDVTWLELIQKGERPLQYILCQFLQTLYSYLVLLRWHRGSSVQVILQRIIVFFVQGQMPSLQGPRRSHRGEPVRVHVFD